MNGVLESPPRHQVCAGRTVAHRARRRCVECAGRSVRAAGIPADGPVVPGRAVLLASFIWVVRLAGTNELAAEGTIAIDGPGLFMQGSILLVAMVSALLIAERHVDPAGDAFARRPRRCREASTRRRSPSRAGCRPRSGRCSCSVSAA